MRNLNEIKQETSQVLDELAKGFVPVGRLKKLKFCMGELVSQSYRAGFVDGSKPDAPSMESAFFKRLLTPHVGHQVAVVAFNGWWMARSKAGVTEFGAEEDVGIDVFVIPLLSDADDRVPGKAAHLDWVELPWYIFSYASERQCRELKIVCDKSSTTVVYVGRDGEEAACDNLRHRGSFELVVPVLIGVHGPALAFKHGDECHLVHFGDVKFWVTH